MNGEYKQDKIVEGTFGRIREVEDFLPPSEALIFKDDNTERITITLTRDTVNFFRQKGQELDAPYQRMIRNLLDEYVHRQRQVS